MAFFLHHGVITSIKNLRIIEFDGQTVRYSKLRRNFPSKTFLLQNDFEAFYFSGKEYYETMKDMIANPNVLIPNKESFPFPYPIYKLFQTDLYLPLEQKEDYCNCPLALASTPIFHNFLYQSVCDNKIIEWLQKEENKETMDMLYELYFEKVKTSLEYQQFLKQEASKKEKQYTKRKNRSYQTVYKR